MFEQLLKRFFIKKIYDKYYYSEPQTGIIAIGFTTIDCSAYKYKTF